MRSLVNHLQSDKELLSIYQKAKAIFKRASMNLREWNSNSEEFLGILPDGKRSFGNSDLVKVLGLIWNLFGLLMNFLCGQEAIICCLEVARKP